MKKLFQTTLSADVRLTWETIYMIVNPLPSRPAPLAVRKIAPTIIRDTVVTDPHFLPMRSPTKPRRIIPQMIPAQLHKYESKSILPQMHSTMKNAQ